MNAQLFAVIILLTHNLLYVSRDNVEFKWSYMKLQYTAVVFEDLMLQVKSTQMQMAHKHHRQWLQSRQEH